MATRIPMSTDDGSRPLTGATRCARFADPGGADGSAEEGAAASPLPRSCQARDAAL